MSISAADVKQLREMTGAGMMDCKKALEEAAGDFEMAIEILRKQGQKLSVKRADRDAKEGVVIALTSDDHKRGIIIRLSCETDFVAKGDSFINLAQSIADVALATFPGSLEELLQKPFDGQLTIAEKILEQLGVIGEKVEVASYEKLEAPLVAPYIHMGYRAAVLVGLSIDNPEYHAAGRDVAMQVAAMKPVAVDENGVDASVIAKEIEIGKEIARGEGKPEEMLEKIARGKLSKFFKENTLLQQQFVKDGTQTVASFLKTKNKDLTVTDFKHVMLG
jgi:elongation factor Ts